MTCPEKFHIDPAPTAAEATAIAAAIEAYHDETDEEPETISRWRLHARLTAICGGGQPPPGTTTTTAWRAAARLRR